MLGQELEAWKSMADTADAVLPSAKAELNAARRDASAAHAAKTQAQQEAAKARAGLAGKASLAELAQARQQSSRVAAELEQVRRELAAKTQALELFESQMSDEDSDSEDDAKPQVAEMTAALEASRAEGQAALERSQESFSEAANRLRSLCGQPVGSACQGGRTVGERRHGAPLRAVYARL